MLYAAAGLLLVLGLFWLAAKPSHNRAWAPDQAVVPDIRITGSQVRIAGVRNFHWTSATDFTPAWDTRTYDLDRLASAWYVLAPFSAAWRGPAHGFVSFGFEDGQFLAVSVEARREAGEQYGVVKGLFRRFELIYLLGDERDLIGRRAVYDGSDVYLYPLRAGPATLRALLLAVLERAVQLGHRPEFYNTLTNNCTTNLVRHVNALVPGRIPATWRLAIPGYSDGLIHRLGLIDSTGTLAEQRARFRINERARAALDAPDFSQQIRRPSQGGGMKVT